MHEVLITKQTKPLTLAPSITYSLFKFLRLSTTNFGHGHNWN